MVIAILSILFLLLIYLTWKKPIYGLMCYFVIRLFVPPSTRLFGLSFNTLSMFMFLLLVLPKLIHSFKTMEIYAKGYMKCMVYVYVGLFALTLLGTTIPLGYQWKNLIQQFGTEILPSMMVLLFLRDGRDFRKFCQIVCIMALFTSIYGIYTYVTSSNPLFEVFSIADLEARDLEEYTNGRLGLTSIAVGIYDDKIALSLITMLLIAFLFVKKYINKYLLLPCLALSFLTLFLTSQRSGLFCTILFLLILFFDRTKRDIRRYIIWAAIVGFFIIVVSDIKIINDWLYSLIYVFDDKMQERMGFGGSNSAMRIMQFTNSLDYLGYKNLLQGEGFDFTSYYYEYIYKRTYYGIDSRFYGFESFLVSTLISSGIIGILIWVIGFYSMFKTLYDKRTLYHVAFFASYLIAILMTNSSASFYLFFFLAALNSKEYLLEYEEVYRYKIRCHS